MTADSTVSQTVTNAGLIQFGDFMTLTTRNYVGAGGTIGLNTFLGADGSPLGQAHHQWRQRDRQFVVADHQCGRPRRSDRGEWHSSSAGINGGTTAPAAFTLAGEVRGGAFDYFLFRGGLGGSSPNDWFLRSTFVVGPVPPDPPIVPPQPPSIPLVPLEPALPIDPPSEQLPPGVFPIIGPSIATLGLVQPIARQLGMTTLGTLHERTGDTALLCWYARAGRSQLPQEFRPSLAILQLPFRTTASHWVSV